MMKLEKVKDFLTRKEVAETGLKSMSALRNDAWLGRGIPFYRVGRSARYKTVDIEAYLAKRKVTPLCSI